MGFKKFFYTRKGFKKCRSIYLYPKGCVNKEITMELSENRQGQATIADLPNENG